MDCPKCKSYIVEDFHTGDSICTVCGTVLLAGLVQESFLNANVNYFYPNTNLATKNDDPLLNNFSLGSLMDVPSTSINKYGKRFEALAVKQNAGKVSLTGAFEYIDIIATRINIADCIIHYAKDLYARIHSRSIEKRGDTFCVACLYIACRQESVPRTLKEICGASEISSKDIGRAFKEVVEITGETLKPIDPAGFLPRFCYSLKLKSNTRMVAHRIIMNIKELKLMGGRNPATVASLAIILAANLEEQQFTRCNLCEVTGTAWNTNVKYFKDYILKQISKVLPKGHRNYNRARCFYLFACTV